MRSTRLSGESDITSNSNNNKVLTPTSSPTMAAFLTRIRNAVVKPGEEVWRQAFVCERTEQMLQRVRWTMVSLSEEYGLLTYIGDKLSLRH